MSTRICEGFAVSRREHSPAPSACPAWADTSLFALHNRQPAALRPRRRQRWRTQVSIRYRVRRGGTRKVIELRVDALTKPLSRPAGTSHLLEVEDLHVQFETSRGIVRAVEGLSFQVRTRRDRRHRRRIRLRQVGVGALHHAAVAAPDRPHSERPHHLRRPQPARSRRRGDARDPRPRHLDDLPGADDLAQPDPDHRAADHRAAAHPSRHERRAGARARRRAAAARRHSRCRAAGSTNIRISFPAACASA